jgi:uncharacterized membrane protein
VSDDEGLAILGLLMVVGILLGVAWIFFNVVVDVVLGVTFAVVGYIAWRMRRQR